VRRALVPKADEHLDDERASGQVVGRAHPDLVAGDLGGGEVKHGELPDREGPIRADAAHGRGVVLCRDVGDGVAEDSRERRAARVVMDGHGDVGREHALAESAEHARSSGPAGSFDDLEGGVIGVGGQDERALRGAGRNASVDLPERVGLRRDPGSLELASDRVEHLPLVVRGGRGRGDPAKDREDLVGID